jgi:hypothetical protein
MKPAVIIGIILIVIGIIGFAWGGLGWTTKRKTRSSAHLRLLTRKTTGLPFRPLRAGFV